eukprot:gnl/MRDRNA2_/MRDRNA2_194022_c0_seq1.p1 gnl/MRDRNA2_/MRDRNA2_194022_c0~~gnl/MRDRNA2_/MRDRNA2_194022_c0_seq1.p1  ORF type:complete len:325 (+),score=24.83 gnl/MRDRNA2_/MRDRNA2_194022_c0_seq1:58-975(+)
MPTYYLQHLTDAVWQADVDGTLPLVARKSSLWCHGKEGDHLCICHTTTAFECLERTACFAGLFAPKFLVLGGQVLTSIVVGSLVPIVGVIIWTFLFLVGSMLNFVGLQWIYSGFSYVMTSLFRHCHWGKYDFISLTRDAAAVLINTGLRLTRIQAGLAHCLVNCALRRRAGTRDLGRLPKVALLLHAWAVREDETNSCVMLLQRVDGPLAQRLQGYSKLEVAKRTREILRRPLADVFRAFDHNRRIEQYEREVTTEVTGMRDRIRRKLASFRQGRTSPRDAPLLPNILDITGGTQIAACEPDESV